MPKKIIFRMNPFAFFFFLMVVICFSGCGPLDNLDEINGIQYEAEYAVPILNSDISIQDFLEDFEENTTIIVDPDGLLHFKYRGDVIKATVDQIYKNINDALPPLIPVFFPGMALPLSSPDGIKIDYLQLKKGDFIFFYESDIQEPITVSITMPQIFKDGQPLKFLHTLPAYSGTGTKPSFTNAFAPTSLEGYTILPENDSIYVDYKVLTATGDTTKWLSNFFLRLQNLEFDYAEGFLGTQVYKGGSDTIVIDFFDNWVQGEVYFEDPVVTFFIDNSFGIPTRSLVNKFNVFTVREEILPLQSRFIENGFDFPYPNTNEVGETKTETFVFTKGNSNIDVILGAGPIAVDYDVDAITNPDGNQGIRGFITDSSFYNVQVEVELPLYGNIRNYIALDTFEIDLGNYDDAEAIEFKLVTENEIPLEVSLQGYFALPSGTRIDSLFESQSEVIEGAPVNSQGNVTDSMTKETYVSIEGNRLVNVINNAKYLYLAVSFSTTNKGRVPVKIVNTQDIKVKIGAKIKVKN